MGNAWPLIARDGELRLVREALHAGRGAVLTGPLGVGKTRLLQEATRLSHDADTATVEISASATAARIPCGVFAPVVAVPLRDPGDPLDVIQRVRCALLEHAGGARLCLAVDDAHLLDDASATLVHELVANGEATLLCSVRTDEPTPDTISALWRDDRVAWIDVPRLTRDQTRELIEAALGGPVDRPTLHRLWALTDGTPLILREYLTEAQQLDTLVWDGGVWRGDPAGLSPPPQLVETISDRLADLGSAERDAVELTAMLGPISSGLLADTVGSRAVERAEAAGLLAARRSGRRTVVELALPAYAVALQQSASETRRQRLRLRLSERLADPRARRGQDHLLLATLRLETDEEVDAELLTRAAKRARATRDITIAEQLAIPAVRHGGGVDAKLLLADASLLLGRDGPDVGRLLAEAATGATSDRERTELALVSSRRELTASGTCRAVEQLDRAAAIVTEPVSRDRLDAARAELRARLADVDAVDDLTGHLLDASGTHPRVRLGAAAAATLAHLADARLFDAEHTAKVGLELVEPRSRQTAVEAALLGTRLALTHAYAGRLGEAEAMAQEHYACALGSQDELTAGLWALALAEVLELQGALRLAARTASEALHLLDRRDLTVHRPVAHGLLAMTTAALGDVDEAEEHLALIDAHTDRPHVAYLAARARAWIAADAGDLRTAADLAARGATVVAAAGGAIWSALLIHETVRFGHPEHALERIVGATSYGDSALVLAMAGHAVGAVRRDPTALATSADSLAKAGARVLAAEAAYDAAATLRGAGKSARARAVATRASELARGLEEALSPHVIACEQTLTPREREIATMAAAGRTSRDIADELVISVRTVDNHLASVYRKLDLGGRRDLPDLFLSPLRHIA